MSSLTPILQKYIKNNGRIVIAAMEKFYQSWDEKILDYKPFKFLDVDRFGPENIPINTKFIFLSNVSSHAAAIQLRKFAMNKGITVRYSSIGEIRKELIEVIELNTDTMEQEVNSVPVIPTSIQEVKTMRAPKRGELKDVVIKNPDADVERIEQILRTMGIKSTENSIRQAIGKYRRRDLVRKEIVKSVESRPAAEVSVSQDDMDKLVSDIKAGIDLLAERARDNSGLRDKLKKLLGE